VGVDLNPDVIAEARRRYGKHAFFEINDATWRSRPNSFDTIVSLAVIEHVSDHGAFLRELTPCLATDGRIVLTTPHPHFEWVHNVGALLGIFSRHAAQEHAAFSDCKAMKKAACSADLEVILYRPFLGGANQLFVLARKPI